MFGGLHSMALKKDVLILWEKNPKTNKKTPTPPPKQNQTQARQYQPYQTNSCTAFDSQGWLFLIGETKKPKF